MKKVRYLSGRKVHNQSAEQRSYTKKSNTGQIQKSKSVRHRTGSKPGSPDTKNINTEKIQGIKNKINSTQTKGGNSVSYVS